MSAKRVKPAKDEPLLSDEDFYACCATRFRDIYRRKLAANDLKGAMAAAHKAAGILDLYTSEADPSDDQSSDEDSQLSRQERLLALLIEKGRRAGQLDAMIQAVKSVVTPANK